MFAKGSPIKKNLESDCSNLLLFYVDQSDFYCHLAKLTTAQCTAVFTWLLLSETFSTVLFSSFNVTVPTSSDRTATIAASILMYLAADTLLLSCFFFLNKAYSSCFVPQDADWLLNANGDRLEIF